jgi:hypothetical protein
MDDYADGAAATMPYLTLIPAHEADLTHLLTTAAIRGCATAEGGDRPWPPGWTPELREACAEACEQVIATPRWRTLAAAGIDSQNDELAWKARQANRILGSPQWPSS